MTRRQLLGAGVSSRAIHHRLRSGLLRSVRPGIYLVALGPQPLLALEAAAVLFCAPRAALSHQTGGRLWRLPVAADGLIHVTMVGRNRHRQRVTGLSVHHIAALPRAELRRVSGLPVTSPSLTLLDLAGVLSQDMLAKCVNEARVQRLVSEAQLAATLRAHPNRRGARALRALLAAEHGPRLLRSDAERETLALMRRHGLEPDASNVWIGPWQVDFLFRRERLVVEFDSLRYHATPKRFVDDRRRVADLGARGFQVFPLSDHDLGAGAPEAMRRLQGTLDQRRALIA